MADTDPTRIDRTIDIAAAPDRVWNSLASVEQLSTWFQVTIEGAIEPGAEVWMTSVHPGYEGQRFSVRIVEMQAPRRLVWQWHPGQVDPAVDYSREPRTTVTFTIEPAPGGTRVGLAETGFDGLAPARRDAVHKDNSQGWSQVLVWLREHAEGRRG